MNQKVNEVVLHKLYIPNHDIVDMFWSKTPQTNHINPKLNVCVVKTDENGNKSWLYGQNMVTDDGDIYYASRAGVAPSNASIALPDPNFFDAACVLQNPATADDNTASGSPSVYPFKNDTYANVTSPIVSTGAVKDVDSAGGYPKVNDVPNLAENTGADAAAVTYKFIWSTAQINTGSGNPITGGCIIDSADASGDTVTAGCKILTHWNFVSPSSFHKTNTDTLTLYVNHTMSGQA